MFQIGMLIARTIRIFLNSVLADIEFHPRRKVFPREITTFCVLLAVAVLAVRNARGESFQLRARVNKIQAVKPTADQTFTISYGGTSSKTAGGTWSDWIPCTEKMWNALRREYPNNGRTNPMVFWLGIKEAKDTTSVDVEVRFAKEPGKVFRMPGELFGTGMGMSIYQEQGKPQAASFAQYNRRFWKGIAGAEIPPDERPKHFPIVDSIRTRGGSNRLTFREGFSALAKAGFNVLGPEVHQPQVGEELSRLGITRTAGGTFTAPGWVCSYQSEADVDRVLTRWAKQQADAFANSGWDAKQVATFAIIDEPHWSMPGHLKAIKASPDGMKRFHNYLRTQGLTPKALGASDWNEVQPIARSAATDLPAKRLFYWTARFATWDSCRHLNLVTRKMEEAFYPGIGVFANWNNFKGRFYVPHGGDKATMHHDWIEFGRLRGANVLWTEDWYASGWQWPFWCAKMASGARKGNIRYGGYIVPRSYGDNSAITQSILSLVGHGGKVVQYFIFGPEYIFPGNCYSHKAHQLLPRMAHAHRMIGKAEDVLWPGRRPLSDVAILSPQSPQVWDTVGPFDATNTLVYFKTMAYMGEIYSQFFSLLRFNIQADFIEELDLTAAGLKPYKLLYVTSPNLSAQHQENLTRWVEQGGTLVTCYGAMIADRYNEPCETFARLTGIRQKDVKRQFAYKVFSLKRLKGSDPKNPWPRGKHGDFCILGFRGGVDCDEAEVLGRFDDGSPAIIQRDLGKGRVIHFAFFPGMSYWGNQFVRMSDWITWPTKLAGIEPRLRVELIEDSWSQIEAPVLLSEAGAAVTLINRTGKHAPNVRITARLPFKSASVESVTLGKVKFTRTSDGRISFSIPVNNVADVVTIKPSSIVR